MASETVHQDRNKIGIYGHTLTLSYPTYMVLGRVGTLNVKTVQSGNGLPSLFLISKLALKNNYQLRLTAFPHPSIHPENLL
jgi:hypothetical protein